MRKEIAQSKGEESRFRFPLYSTLLTESVSEKTRHPAIVLELSETGGEFRSPKKVVPGESVSIILHPNLRYAVRGRVAWTRQMQDEVHFNFGVIFEDEIPNSLWDILGQNLAA